MITVQSPDLSRGFVCLARWFNHVYILSGRIEIALEGGHGDARAQPMLLRTGFIVILKRISFLWSILGQSMEEGESSVFRVSVIAKVGGPCIS